MDVNHWLQQQEQEQQQQSIQQRPQNLAQQSIQQQQKLGQQSIQQRPQNLAQQSIQQPQNLAQRPQNPVHHSIQQQRQLQNLIQHCIQQPQLQNQVHPAIQHLVQQRQQQQQNLVHQSIQPQNLVQQSMQHQNLVQRSIQQQQNLVQHTIQQQQPRQQQQELVQQSIQQRQQNLVQQSETFKNLYNTDGSVDVADLPQFHRLQEQDFVEKNSQVMPIDFFQTQPISTGLGLSLDNSSDLLVNEIQSQLSQDKDGIDQFLTVEAEKLMREVLEKTQISMMRTISFLKQMFLEQFRAKENELEKMSKRNNNLVQQIGQLSKESQMWQQRSNYNENMSKELNLTLERLVNAQIEDSKEGCGDNGVDDNGSCVNGQTRLIPFMCIVCEAKGACAILMPCKHLCICKDCESGLRVCPICQTPKISCIDIG